MICTICKEDKELNNFANCRRNKDGKKHQCKTCRNEQNRIIRNANKDKYNENKREWRENKRQEKILNGEIKIKYDDGNKKECTFCCEIKSYSEFTTHKAHCKTCERTRYLKWYENNKQRVVDYQRKYKKDNPIATKKERQKYNKNNKEKIATIGKKWRENNRKKMATLKREWRIKNPTKDAEYNHKRRSLLKDLLTSEDINDILVKSKLKCYWCGTCCREGHHLDHYMPLSKGGKNIKDNIVVACPACNLSKGAKLPAEYANTKGRLL